MVVYFFFILFFFVCLFILFCSCLYNLFYFIFKQLIINNILYSNYLILKNRNLDHNKLTGLIPPEIGKLTNLKKL